MPKTKGWYVIPRVQRELNIAPKFSVFIGDKKTDMICANLGGIGLKVIVQDSIHLNTNDEVLADLIINSVEDGIDKFKKLIQGPEKIGKFILKKD